MIISHNKKFVFIHIPKVAGKTVRKLLHEYNDHSIRYWGFQKETPLERGIDRAHIPLIDLKTFSPSDFTYLSQYFVFAFVRNPYDRFYSAFQEHIRQRKLPSDTDFNNYVQQHINHSTIRYDWRFVHFCPQIYFTHIGVKSQVDFIGRLENLPDDMQRLSHILNLRDFEELQLIPSTLNGSSLEHYTNETIELVNNLYRSDFDYYRYPIVEPSKSVS